MPRINTKKGIEAEVRIYLESANPDNIDVPNPIPVGRWTDAHGEGRTASALTFHLRIMLQSNGNYATCIAHKQQGRVLIVEGSKKEDWGDHIVPAEVLKHYQDFYGVTKPSKEPEKKKK
ncbi:hypothetical protein NW768_007586 [Fusarium equiseti]|uniref:Uncharacterized protein n=1 Tax=Fusarium equiseti TaxID=61235 RepID=A0ABQ8R8K7_FUSEQ|nr:hypothetical protein NW768_007586 [Fusarium equiseti]